MVKLRAPMFQDDEAAVYILSHIGPEGLDVFVDVERLQKKLDGLFG